MGLYNRYAVPWLTNLSCGTKPIRRQRQKVVPLAEGRVLEIGIGSGLNFPFYDPDKVDVVIGLDPAPEMLTRARRNAEGLPFDVEWLGLEGENIPLEDGSVDTVLLTYTLCTIPDALAALGQMRRVLKPDGHLVFCEHGKAPDAKAQRWQNRLNPIWKRLAGGCNLNRDTIGLLQQGGFRVETEDSMYLPGTPRFAGYNVWGTARVD